MARDRQLARVFCPLCDVMGGGSELEEEEEGREKGMEGKRAQGNCCSEPQAASHHFCPCFRILTLPLDLSPASLSALRDQPGRLLRPRAPDGVGGTAGGNAAVVLRGGNWRSGGAPVNILLPSPGSRGV